MDYFVEYYNTVYNTARPKKRLMSSKQDSSKLASTAGNEKEANPSLEVRENDKLFKEKFATLFNDERLSDIILHVGDEYFYAHRFMLVVGSEVFEAMLNEERWRESKLPEVTLTEVDECVPVFSHFLKYLYTGCVSLTTDDVLPILLLADKYSISSLSQTCIEYMLHHVVESPDTNRTLSWYQYGKMTANALLVDKCRKFILSNFDIILKTSDWMNLSKTEVTEFLSSNDLVVSDEFYLWQKIEKWLNSKYEDDELSEVIADVIPLLHFTMTPPKQLLEIEKSELFEKHKSVFAEKLSAAYRHHSLLFDEVELKTSKERFRNYTSDMYGICLDLCLPNYRTVDKGDSKIVKQVFVPVEFMSSSGSQKNNERNTVRFQIVYFPKGPFKTFSWYGHLSDNASLSARMISRHKTNFQVNITFIVFGVKNGVRYVAFSYTNSHTFTFMASAFIEDNLMVVKRLMDENSPYLVNGNLEAKLFIKIVNVIQPEESTSK